MRLASRDGALFDLVGPEQLPDTVERASSRHIISTGNNLLFGNEAQLWRSISIIWANWAPFLVAPTAMHGAFGVGGPDGWLCIRPQLIYRIDPFYFGLERSGLGSVMGVGKKCSFVIIM